MQDLLDNNDILMCSRHDEGKSVIAERFVKTLKSKIFKRMTANDNKSYLPYLNKLVDQYSNTYHHSINKKPINTDYSGFTEKLQTNPKAPMFEINDRIRITKYTNLLVNAILKISQEKYLLSILFQKLILGVTNVKI